MSGSGAAGQNYFSMLGLEPGYEVDEAALRDAFERGGDSSSGDALRTAYATLSDPVLRAAYLLDLYGSPAEASSVPVDLGETLAALEREAGGVKASGDAGAMGALKQKLMTLREERVEQIRKLFSFPRGVPNAVAQWSRDQGIWAEINAVRRIDGMMG